MPQSPVERRHQRARGNSISALTISSATSVALPVAISPNMKGSGIKSEARSPTEDFNATVWPLAYDQSHCQYFQKTRYVPDACSTTPGTLGKNLGRRQQASWSLPPTPVPPRHAAHDRAAASRLRARTHEGRGSEAPSVALDETPAHAGYPACEVGSDDFAFTQYQSSGHATLHRN